MDFPNLKETVDFDQVRLKLPQNGLRMWLNRVIVLFVLCFLIASSMSAEAFLALSIFFVVLITVLILIPEILFPTLALRVTPNEVEVRGWLGGLPSRGEAHLPIPGLTINTQTQQLIKFNGEPMRWIRLSAPDHKTVWAPMVTCSAEELAHIRTRISEMKALGEARRGAGADEIPDALRALQARQDQQ